MIVAAQRLSADLGISSSEIRAASPRRGVGRLTEPVPRRIVRALPEVDVRLVGQRGAAG